MGAREQFVTALNEVIADLEASDDSCVADAGSMSLRLETLGETALLNGDIPMEVIDLLNHARQKLNKITEPLPPKALIQLLFSLLKDIADAQSSTLPKISYVF